ncbi:sodium:proton antiporter [Aeromicrobium sp. Root495]|uniref:Na+/H+ antiporter n=1 Tax=Aeromicrobium sp. Root495 TaxID=1736550 RepID=UPI0006FAAD5D|nr:Na+/H+ antiporter [Aeromicrobium sp. Root495]KQY58565.1 sodium:proton antiporter [Aeromicrobium sp. Root495]
MELALTLVIIVAITVAVSSLAERFTSSTPLVLIASGIACSYLPFVPDVELTPEIVLIGLLPPLLYAASIRTSLIDFKANRRPILLLSVGLVVFTTLGVGLVVWWLLPVKFSVALALGAVVAPPDAVAASAVARRVGLPRRIVTILEGESLVNDATAIVTLRAAIAAIAGTVSFAEVSTQFVVSAVGGALIGYLVALVVTFVRRYVTDDLTDVAISLLTPWLAYLPAEELHLPGTDAHASGVLAVVVAGLILGHRSPAIQSATSRMFERTNWATISFILENAVFLLIGLQIKSIVSDVSDSDLGTGLIIGTSAAVLGAVIALRMIWIFPATYLPRLIPHVRRADPSPPWTTPVIIGWAGMRGVVTLAAVFLLPEDTAERPVLVMVAFVVTVGTLLLQGLTLPWLVRALKVEGPDRHEDHLQEANVYQAAVNAGLEYLEEHAVGEVPDDVVERLRSRALDRANGVWERLGGAETPTAQYSRTRAKMLAKERQAVLEIRDDGLVDQSVLQRVLNALDVEESILDRLAENESTAERETELRPEAGRGCEHLADVCGAPVPTPITPNGCEECLRDGHEWVHLRLCLTCGHVGCCDSSVDKHATRHFEETGHPVMRSFEPGEAWRWCFVDGVTG